MAANAQIIEALPFGDRAKRQASTFAVWFCASVLLVPFVLMIHEMGHLLIGLGLGFHHLRLHYESVSYAGQDEFWHFIQSGNRAAAAAITSFWKVAALEMAGPLVSLACRQSHIGAWMNSIFGC